MPKPTTQKITNKIVRNFPEVVGFIRSGTFKGKDYDLWCITYDEIDNKTTDKIKNILHTSPDDIDLFFHTLKQFETGDMGDRKGSKAHVLMDNGLDPHEKQFHFDDTSMLGLYNYASAKQFGKSKKSLYPEKILQNISVTYEGVIDWINFYTLAFLRHYIRNPQKKNERFISRQYIERMAKLLIRVAFGYFAAKMIIKGNKQFVTDMFRIKGSPGMKIFQIIKHSSMECFGKEEMDLIESAVQIRMQDVIPRNIDSFMSEGINAIFFWSSFIGAEKRVDCQIDQFIALSLLDWVKKEKPEVHRKGTVVIKEGKSRNSDIYYLPPYKTDGSTNGKALVTIKDKKITEISSGRLIGEVRALGGSKQRTSTVTALQDIEMYCIPFKYVKNIISKQKDLIISERTKSPKDIETRKLDIFLRYLLYGSYEFLESEVYTKPLKKQMNENISFIRRRNPFRSLFLGEKLTGIFSQLFNSNFSLDRKEPMIQKLSFHKGEKICSKGEQANKLFYIIDGIVSVLKDSEDTKNFVRIYKGIMFGESSFPAFRGIRLNSAYALSDVTLYAIDPTQFLRFTLTGSELIEGYAPIELLYNLVAQNIGRFKYIDKVLA